MVAKIIAWGRDRTEAIARLRRALRDTTVVIEGGTTNKSFVLDLLSRPEVLSGSADTAWLDRTGLDSKALPAHADIALYAVRSTCTRTRRPPSVRRSWSRPAAVARRPTTPSAGPSRFVTAATTTS